MDLIDDKGRLFGTVNIIDALAVLLVLAVVAAGAAFVLQPSDKGSTQTDTNTNITGKNYQNATRYATLDLGTQPSYVAERITDGDDATLIDGNLTVTDVYRRPTKKGVHVWVRVELDGQIIEQQNNRKFVFAGSQPKIGSKLSISTNEYQVNGTIHDLAPQNSSLPGGHATVVLRTTTSADKAAAIQKGDTTMVANGTVATIESVTVYPTGDPNKKQVVLGVTMETLIVDGQQEFLGYQIQIGHKVPFSTEDYAISGKIVKRGSLELPSSTASVVVQTHTSAEKAAAIDEGDTFDASGRSIATVESVAVYPTGNANKKRVVLGLTVETLDVDGTQSFLGTPIQLGQKIPFRTDAYQLNGKIVHRGNTTLPGERTTTTATIKLSNVAPEIADGIATGMVERINDRVNAKIVEKRVEPATVVVKSQDGEIHEREHPQKKDVYLTVELQTRRTDAGLYFHGKQLQEGNGLVLDLGSITVHGQVIDLQAEG